MDDGSPDSVARVVIRYAHLPEPIRRDQMITSSEASPHPPERDDYWREVEWMLRVSGLG